MNMELGAAIAIFNNCFRKVEEDEYIDTKHGASYSKGLPPKEDT